MKFVIAAYEKDSDSPDGLTDISAIGADSVADLLKIPVELLADVWPLNEDSTAVLHVLTGMDFDLDSREYFLEVLAD